MKFITQFFVDVLSDWQTLIAGVLALLGAWITVSTMRKQEADENI